MEETWNDMTKARKIEALDKSLIDCHLIEDTWNRHNMIEFLARKRFVLKWGLEIMVICMVLGIIIGSLLSLYARNPGPALFCPVAALILGVAFIWVGKVESGVRAIENDVFG